MEEYSYYWGGGLAFVGAIRMLYYTMKKKSISKTLFRFYLFISLFMVCLGIFTIVYKKFDGFCLFSYGVIAVYTLYKGDYKPAARFTSVYGDYIADYVIDIILIISGLCRIFDII